MQRSGILTSVCLHPCKKFFFFLFGELFGSERKIWKMISTPFTCDGRKHTATILIERVEPGNQPAAHFCALTKNGKVDQKRKFGLRIGAQLSTILVEAPSHPRLNIIKQKLQNKIISIFNEEIVRDPEDFLLYIYNWVKREVEVTRMLKSSPWPLFYANMG